MDNQEGNAPEGDEKLDLDQIDPESASPEEVKKVIDFAKTVKGQKEHWRGKALDPETGKPYRDILEESKQASKPANQLNTQPARSEDPVETLANDVQELKLEREKRLFGHSHSLSPEETDIVYAQAQGSKVKPEEALKSDFMQTALEATRRKARIESATPRPSSRTTVVERKSVREMSSDEKRKNWGRITGAER